MKKIFCCLITLLIPFIFMTQVEAKPLLNSEKYILLEGEEEQKIIMMDTTCQDFSNVLRMVGYIILLVKIAVPLIIIVKASINLIKVTTSGKPEELKKQATKLATSCVAGIIIFFIPTIVYTVMNMTDAYGKNITADANVCKECILNPGSCSVAKDKADAVTGIQEGLESVIDSTRK